MKKSSRNEGIYRAKSETFTVTQVLKEVEAAGFMVQGPRGLGDLESDGGGRRDDLEGKAFGLLLGLADAAQQ
eukprot:622180-Rhodomonas_salina.2